jgi:glycosyltransferase XagB
MRELDIVIPVKNEENNLLKLCAQIGRAMRRAKISYQMIFVVDKSTDNTLSLLHQLSNSYPIHIHEKVGKPGKGYSLIEGSELAEAPFIAFIDGDLQYPPSAIPEMYSLIQEKDVGVVVAHRKAYHAPFYRKIGSYADKLLFGRLLLGMKCDTQSGLKLFKKHIFEHMEKSHVGSWTFDIPLLHEARELGHKIKEVDIQFSPRMAGTSNVRFFRAAIQIATVAIKTRLRDSKVYHLATDGHPHHTLVYKQKRFVTHTQLPHHKSALYTFKTWQKLLLASLVLLIALGLALNPVITFIFFIAILSSIYFSDMLFNLYLIIKNLRSPPEIKATAKDINSLKDEDLPVYTILCPLYKEARVLPQFVDSISKIDWPKDKLDILLLLEDNDTETIQAAENLDLPPYITTVIVPFSEPKTKPKACNYGLHFAKGEYVVVYDAEDIPDPEQLKKAYLAFTKLSEKVFCVQAKLNYYNTDQNLLTKLFTAEYSLWFDVILPGLQVLETAIPLGGTSNHFKVKDLINLHGWDPFNVTEDCDLGMRLFKEGYRTAIIDSTTLEEANSNVKNWIRQRSRWIKGYLQTYLVHMRDPVEFFKTHGWHALLFQLTIGLRISFILINPILWVTTISYFVLNQYVGPAIESVYPPPVFYIAVTSLIFGNFLYLYNYMIGLAKRENWSVIKYVYLVPFYWVLMSVAAFIAFYQLFFKPHYWEKTTHGLHFERTIKRGFVWPSLPQLPSLPHLIPGLRFSVKRRVRSVLYNLHDFSELFTPSPKTLRNKSVEKNVLMFNWRDTKHKWAGGAEVYLHEIAKELVKKGYNVTLFCGNDHHCPRHEVIDQVNIIRRGGFFTVYVWAFVYYIFKFRNKFGVIVDSENGVPFFTPLYVKRPIIGLVHHIHQEIFRDNLPKPLASFACYLEGTLMPRIYKNVRMVTVSNSSKIDMEALGLGNENGIEIINPGLNLQNFGQGKKSETPTILYLGRLKPYKSVDVALKALKNLLQENFQAKLKIAGFGHALDDLRQLAKELNIEDHVEFLGKVSEEEKIRLLREAWAFVYPSSMEGWGIAALEASASGTPVIASDVRGLRDSVKNPHTGFLVPYKDVDAFSNKLRLVLSDEKLRKHLGDEGVRWSKQFTWEKSADKLIGVIDETYKINKRLDKQINKAVVLAGGNGTRLWPLTNKKSKVLLPVGGKPMILHIIEKVVSAGTTDVALIASSKHMEEFKDLLGNGGSFGLSSVTYILHPEKTIGMPAAIGLAKNFIEQGERFLVTCGDVIIESGINAFIEESHRQEEGARILALKAPNTKGFNRIENHGDKVLTIYDKNDSYDREGFVDSGTYIYEYDVFEKIQTLKPSSRGETKIWDLNKLYMQENKLRVTAYDTWWADVGKSLQTYYEVNKRYEQK